MKLQRALGMGQAEILCRSRQQLHKFTERMSASGLLPTPARTQPMPAPRGSGVHGHGEPDLQAFHDRAALCFFAGASEASVSEAIHTHHGAERQQFMAAADGVCRGEFDILGYGRLNFRPSDQDELNWHFDPVSGRTSPLVHWSRIDALDASRLGDSKVVWELSRHQWLLDLGQAYRCSGDEVYAEAFARHITDWMHHNPPGLGIHWHSSLELAYRLISWCWALVLFRGSGALTPALFAEMSAWIRIKATHIERYLSYYYSPNTHLTGEALGLFYVGTLFPGFADSPRWQALGRDILLKQLTRQVYPDGVYFEQSTGYQCYTVDIYLQLLMLSRRNKLAVPAFVEQRLKAMLDFLLNLRRPDGNLPQIGDGDGGSLLPLVRRSPQDCRGIFAVAAACFQREDYAWAAGNVTPEVQWLLGAAGRQQMLALAPQPPPLVSTACYPDGGYAIQRNQWEGDAHQLIFDAGPLGCSDSAAHGHADMLSIQCSAFGESYLEDAGTCCYTASAHWRDHFRSTQAHSTATVDDYSQAQPVAPFAWQAKRPAAVFNRNNRPDGDLLDASHNAWRHLNDPVGHRRRVLFVRSRYWIVVDDFDGANAHRIALRYQFAELPLSVRKNAWYCALGRNGSAFLIKAFSTARLSMDLCAGANDPPRGWLSRNYGLRTPAPVLTYTVTRQLPLRIVSVLFPLQNAGRPSPAVMFNTVSNATWLTLGSDGYEDTICIRDHDITVQGGASACVA